MKIVIDIPERDYDLACNYPDALIATYAHYIKDGTPLPKGHGRLIDADAYIDKTAECGWLDDIPVDEFNRITQTVIEADDELLLRDKDCKACKYYDNNDALFPCGGCVDKSEWESKD